ncbi:MAG: alpha/beta fold hydrolase [Oceanococcus sp.]
MKNALVVLSALLSLSACSPDDGNVRLDEDFGPKPLFDPVGLPTNTRGAILPVPVDLLFGREPGSNDNPDDNADGTLAPAGSLAALPDWGLVDGWSTTAAMFFSLQGKVDPAQSGNGVRIFDSRTARELIPGEDFSLSLSPVSIGSSRILVDWLKPLDESTRYLVGLTKDIKSPNGARSVANELFSTLNQDTVFSEQAGSTLLASLSLLGKPELIPQLDALQATFIAPIVAGLQQLSAVSPNSRGPIARDDLTMAWSFTTQSITPTLKSINDSAGAQFIQAGFSGLNLAQALGSPTEPLPLPDNQNPDIYAGAFSLPYYQKPGAENILTSNWQNDGVISAGTIFPANGVPCEGLLPPQSTTICYPAPLKQDDLLVPLLLTRPKGSMPAGGWPVVVFLHGITGNRSQMFGIAGALASAGLVAVAIDQPLHGLPPGSPLRVPGTTERTFDADLDDDGEVDASGSHFINLPRPVTSRDNIRQSVADQIHLIRSLGGLRIGSAQDETINTDQVYFLGHSLGGIVGGTLLGVNQDIKAASLAMPGGGIPKLLDASANFGPVVAGGLAAAGIERGTDSYEIFLRFAQLSVDAADPINWAKTAAKDRALHLIEVIGDQVVPNTALNDVIVPGLLSGTQPLAIAAGLSPTTITPPVETPSVLQGSQWIQFNGGNHGSVLAPTTANPLEDPVFVEMQRQVASFLASNGACLPIGGNCPQAQ